MGEGAGLDDEQWEQAQRTASLDPDQETAQGQHEAKGQGAWENSEKNHGIIENE